ncbi:hypothetical protein [Desulfosporosinus sp. OT]|uniref:hypothetical protein n=1 Tax=Desulfosporosinus sp. OT TaxID=913865 RepID=UPI000223A8D3|nr:hypothetical protein [Desulfosporosinus sp. OT]EGW39787.1 hypothetical protein DOT_2003 [Desulfosporosinus sp. OT]
MPYSLLFSIDFYQLWYGCGTNVVRKEILEKGKSRKALRDVHFLWSRWSESNRRPAHYESFSVIFNRKPVPSLDSK